MVELVVDGLGPTHELWAPVRRRLRNGKKVSWLESTTVEALNESALHARVRALSSELAIRRAVAQLIEAGRALDPENTLFWSGVRATARRAGARPH